MKRQHPVTPELIRAALIYIPASLPRDEWARVAMAIKSEFLDETGFDLFDQWSQTAGELYDAKATKDTWRSVKAAGGVSIGTLWFLAKSHGFTFPQGDTAPAPPDPEAAARHARERAERDRAERDQTEARQAKAASDAHAQWEAASEAGEGAYLRKRGVQAYGLRFGPGGAIVIPIRDAGGKLWNLQTIKANATGDGFDKRFMPRARVSGLWHLLGTTPADPGAVVLVAEGYATGASLHEATGYPVAVAFDSGNLGKVARALRELYPAALLAICGDDDQENVARTGKNTGRIAATAAAKEVNGLALFPPEGLAPGQNFDFNDLHAHHGGPAGLAAVRETVQAGIDAHRARLATAQAATSPAGKPSRPTRTKSARPAADDDASEWDRFDVIDAGVMYHGVDRDGNPTKPEWVCSRLDVEALTRDQDGNGWGYLLTFADHQGRRKQWAMPARMLSGDGGEYRATLLHMGLKISVSPRARNLLAQYIQTRQPEENALCTDKTGWHGRAFVLPHETIGDDEERIVFQTDSAMENTIRAKGTGDQWRQRVAALCVGNSRLAFAVSCAFAGPLLRPAGVESGGFHFRGDSSSGKTTALKLAASVWGGASYLQRWRTTDNALEAIAAQHSDLLLILDELAQVDPKTAGECAYMLANEQSKARATRNGAARPRLSWRLLFLSAGELGLADHMAEGMKRTRAGQEIRMADIPADAGRGLGAFESLHDQDGGAGFSSHATAQAAALYGTVGREWLQWLTANTGTLKASIREMSNDLMLSMVPELAGGQVQRVGARFALVGAAGELATAAGLTGWPKGEAERAARACFNAWLAARAGGTGNSEVSAMLRQVQGFLAAHGEGRFTWWHRAADDHSAKTLMRAGFRRMVNERGEPIKTDAEHERNYGERITPLSGESVSAEFFILPEVFRGEVCKGFDFEAVCKVLAEHGCLMMNEPGRHAKKVKLPGIGQSRCYHVGAKIFELEL